jgi:hypothetical protein
MASGSLDSERIPERKTSIDRSEFRLGKRPGNLRTTSPQIVLPPSILWLEPFQPFLSVNLSGVHGTI